MRAFLRERVTVGEDARLDGGHDRGFPVALTVELKGGRVEEHAVEHPPGSPKNPLGREDLRAKFDANVQRSALAERSFELWETAWSLGGDGHTLPALDRLLRR